MKSTKTTMQIDCTPGGFLKTPLGVTIVPLETQVDIKVAKGSKGRSKKFSRGVLSPRLFSVAARIFPVEFFCIDSIWQSRRGIWFYDPYETPAQVGVYSPGVLLPPLPVPGTIQI